MQRRSQRLIFTIIPITRECNISLDLGSTTFRLSRKGSITSTHVWLCDKPTDLLVFDVNIVLVVTDTLRCGVFTYPKTASMWCII